MLQNAQEFATELQNLISEALAAGIPADELAAELDEAAEALRQGGEADE